MKRWLLSHLGCLAFLAGYAWACFFPILDGGILSDPWEMLFDWAGEVVAMSYLGILINFVNLLPAAACAGLLDRAPRWHALLLILITVCLASVIWHNSFVVWLALICGFVISILLGVAYLAVRGLRDGLLKLFRHNFGAARAFHPHRS